MVPRRKTWLQRLGGVAKPESVGAALVILATWGEGRHHTDAVAADVSGETQVLLARVISVERWKDSTAVRLAYLERQEHRRRHHVRASEDPEPGSGFAPEERGHLLASIGKAFKKILFFWPSDGGEDKR